MKKNDLTTLNLSIKQENLVKLNEIKLKLKPRTTLKYKGRISNAVVLNSLIELLYENHYYIGSVSSNDEVGDAIKKALIHPKKNK